MYWWCVGRRLERLVIIHTKSLPTSCITKGCRCWSWGYQRIWHYAWSKCASSVCRYYPYGRVHWCSCCDKEARHPSRQTAGMSRKKWMNRHRCLSGIRSNPKVCHVVSISCLPLMWSMRKDLDRFLNAGEPHSESDMTKDLMVNIWVVAKSRLMCNLKVLGWC
jgi:hypothetical protein